MALEKIEGDFITPMIFDSSGSSQKWNIFNSFQRSVFFHLTVEQYWATMILKEWWGKIAFGPTWPITGSLFSRTLPYILHTEFIHGIGEDRKGLHNPHDLPQLHVARVHHKTGTFLIIFRDQFSSTLHLNNTGQLRIIGYTRIMIEEWTF